MALRDYQSATITVHWDSSRCVHSAICLRGLPAVFDTARRPWVDIDAAAAGEIADVIRQCPSGALRYTLPDGPPEQPDPHTTIIPWPNGPLWVRGDVEVRDRHGNLFRAGPRMALCRCGNSQNQPFCDMSHVAAGFRDYPKVVTETRDLAESPGDLEGGSTH